MSSSAKLNRLGFRFRWKYAVSAFLVCGVLSLTIGSPGRPDALIVEAQRVQKLGDQLFKINKDPKTAKTVELFGPAERTYLENSEQLKLYVGEVTKLGRMISQESFRRGGNPTNKIDGPEIIAVAESVKLYGEMQRRLYKNYMRLAHDAQFKTYQPTNLARYVLEVVLIGKTPADQLDRERWTELNKDALSMTGANSFSPTAYDFLNIRIHPSVAQILYTNKEANKQYSLRHVKDKSGTYAEVEHFLNSYDKQMAEYEAIQEPATKAEYMKLVQFAAIREGMTNRWAIRRMAGARIERELDPKTDGKPFYKDETPKLPSFVVDPQTGSLSAARTVAAAPKATKKAGPKKFVFDIDKISANRRYHKMTFLDDPTINACGADLVSFRTSRKGKVDDVEAYSALWQADRHTDLIQLAKEAAVKVSVGKPLLSDQEYGELFGTFIAAYPGFQTQILPDYVGNVEGLQNYLATNFGKSVRLWEESRWSVDPVEGVITGKEQSQKVLADDIFHLSNFPADDLSLGAVAERYAEAAYRMRSLYLAEAIGGVAGLVTYTTTPVSSNMYEEVSSAAKTTQLFPEVAAPEAKVSAVKLTQEYLAEHGKQYKAKFKAELVKAMQAKLGMEVPTANGNPAGTGYATNQDQKRYDAYAEDMKAIASVGARGVNVRRSAQKVVDQFDKDLFKLVKCETPKLTREEERRNVGRGTKAAPSTLQQESCRIGFTDPATIAKKDIMNSGWYLGKSPIRNDARSNGVTDIILPQTPDQLSSFFKKKLEAVFEYDAKFAEKLDNSKVRLAYPHGIYGEIDVAKQIAENPVVMRGMDMFFGEIAGAVEKSAEAKQSAAQNPMTLVGADQGMASNQKQKLSPDELSKADNAAAEQARAALEAAIIPTAKTFYKKFIQGLSEKGTYRYPEAAARAKIGEVRQIMPDKSDKAAYSKAAAAIDDKKFKNGYFRTGRDRSFDMKGGELYVEDTVKMTALKSPESYKAAIGKEIRVATVANKNFVGTLAKVEAQTLRLKIPKIIRGKNGKATFEKEEISIPMSEVSKAAVEVGISQREEAKRLFREALAMIGISIEATKGMGKDEAVPTFTFSTSTAEKTTTYQLADFWLIPDVIERNITSTETTPATKHRYASLTERVRSWITIEYFQKKKFGNVRLLERMVLSPIDQIAMGKVLAQESIARAPILTLQSGWGSKKDFFGREGNWNVDEDKDEPILLEKLAGAYRPEVGWGNSVAYHAIFKDTLASAARNEQGKVETFCRASVKNYQNDSDFRKMFGAVSGIRGVLSSYDSKAKAWDASITKEARTWDQTLMEDYIDPYMTPLMIAMFIVIAWQVLLVAAPALTASITSAAAAGSFFNQALIWLAKLTFFQATGNLGIINLIFMFQSATMVSTYHYRLPAQMGFTYELANSRIQNMQDGKFAGVSLVDRDRLKAARAELLGNQMMANVALAGEFLQFRYFTGPALLRSLGITGAIKANRLGRASQPAVVDAVRAKSLQQHIREKGFSKGLGAYWAESARLALKTLERVSVVKGGEQAEKGLATMLGNSLASRVPLKKTLREFYETELRRQRAIMKELQETAQQRANKWGIKDMAELATSEQRMMIEYLGDMKVQLGSEVARIEGEAFGTVVITAEYADKLAQLRQAEAHFNATLAEVGGGRANRRKGQATMLAISRAVDAEKKVGVLERLLENLDKVKPVMGEPETAAFFNKFAADDFSVNAEFFRGGNPVLDKETRRLIKRDYDDFAYLKQDWERSNNAWAKSVGLAVRTGYFDMAFDSQGNRMTLDSNDFREHPEKYEILTISSKRLGIGPGKKPTK